MIYRFNLISDEVDDFKLEIQIDSDDTFLSLRNVILDAAGYTKDQMDSFIICDEEWNKEKEVTLTDMGADSDEDIWLMDETKISELIDAACLSAAIFCTVPVESLPENLRMSDYRFFQSERPVEH